MGGDLTTSIAAVWNAFFHSTFMFYIKIIAAFVTAVLLIADLLLIRMRLAGDIKVALYGSKIPFVNKAKYAKTWSDIRKRLELGSVASGKVAIIESDRLLGEILEKMGYAGKDTDERIKAVKPGLILGIEDAAKSHEIFKKIIQDPSYEISLEEIRSVMDAYERVFNGLELLESS
ncbi:MAG: hypothetical protein WC858_05355 [Parcubacteria group bacterium]|jgi:hypothetical protein